MNAPIPIYAYWVMLNHWHFVFQPQTDTLDTNFFRWMTDTHAMRWNAHYHTEGTGHLYQGLVKTFPIEEVEHCLQCCAKWSGMHCEPIWSNTLKIGSTAVYGVQRP